MAAHGENQEFCVKLHSGEPTSSVWLKDARGLREGVANEVPVVDGFEGPPLSPPFNLLMVTIAELEERLLCVVPGGIEASLRKRGKDPLIGSLTRPGRPVEGGTATPIMAKR